MQEKQAIGIFDSGVGGTSIWKEIVTRLPYENTIYLADSINAPYGEKSKEEIIALSVKNTEKLIALGSKLIVVACNTATTNAITHLRSTYDIPFIGIEPAIKPAALKTKSKTIGILATQGTLNSNLFHSSLEKYAQDVTVIEVIGKGLVPFIESGDLESHAIKSLLQSYIDPMLEAGIDYLVLGCSHYPYLIPLLRQLIPNSVEIIDSGLAVARQTEAVLSAGKALKNSGKGVHQLYSNGDEEILKRFVSRFRESALKTNLVSVNYYKF